MLKRFCKSAWPYFAVIVLAFVIEIPQLTSGHLILGADTLFHYNRFYDAGMQILHANFNYFASVYGYNQCGRIVNAVYSPYFAYLQGGLLDLCGTWFRYQICTDVLVMLLAAASITAGLKIAKLWVPSDRFIVLLYPFTYQVAHWTVSTNFTAWGTVVLPLAVGCVARMFTNSEHPINGLQFGVITALVIQVHFVTALEMLFIYVLFVPYAWYRALDRKRFAGQLFAAAGLTLALDANILGGLWETFSGNYVTPLSRLRLSSERIFSVTDGGDGRFVTSALFLLVTLLALIVIDTHSRVARYFGVLSVVFYLLSMPIPIWNEVFANNKWLGVIQYPSRLLVPAVTLSAFFLGFILKEDLLVNWLREFIEFLGVIFVVCSVLANFCAVQVFSRHITATPGIRPFAVTAVQKRRRLHGFEKGADDPDLGYLPRHAYQGVADYMPMSHRIPFQKGPSSKVYWDNMHYVNEPADWKRPVHFHKYVAGHSIVTTFDLPHAEDVTLPLVEYRHTDIQLDHRDLKYAEPKYKHSLKVPTVSLDGGHHVATTVYRANPVCQESVPFSLMAWLLTIMSFGAWQAFRWDHRAQETERKREKPLVQALPKGHF